MEGMGRNRRRNLVVCLSAAFALFIAQGIAQAQFTDIGADLTGVAFSSAAWGDYDNDGDPDIILTGLNEFSVPISQVWRNDLPPDPELTFTDIGAGLTGVQISSVAWGDYDNDSDLDVLITGLGAGSKPVSQIWRNNGVGSFTNIGAGLTGVWNSSAGWGDYDNDGDLDILLTGDSSTGTRVSQVWRNDFGTFTNSGVGLTGVSASSAAWGDYDNDGDLDILLTGRDARNVPVTQVWHNDGLGVFANIGAALTGVAFSSAAWGDYDNDSDLDILLTGLGNFGMVSQVLRNDGAGVFINIGAGLTPVWRSSVAWGDYDNDGDLDILLTGRDVSNKPLAQVWRNDGDDVFANVGAVLSGVMNSSAAWGDYDNDSDLDILLTGTNATGKPVSQVWRNELATNEAPLASAGGPYTVECRDVADGFTSLVLDGSGSSDPDGDLLAFLWSADQGVLNDASLEQPTLDVTGVAPGTTFDVTLAVDDGLELHETTTTVTVQDTYAPVLTCPENIVQEAASPQGNVVNYAPTAVDAADASPSVVSSPPSGTTFPVGTTTVVMVTATDATGNQSQCSFSVTILSASDVLEDIETAVGGLGLNSGNTNALLRILRNAQISYAAGKTNAACSQLAAFIANLQGQIDAGKVDAAAGQELIDSANSVRAMLGC